MVHIKGNELLLSRTITQSNTLICKHIICNSLKGVDQMVDQLSANYLYRRNNVFYFTKRVPKDLSNFYVTNRIVISLKTKSNISAMRASKSLTQKLEDYWTSLRITKFEVPVQHLLSKDKSVVTSSEAPKLSEALSLYLKLKGIGKDKTFVRVANRNIR